MKNPNIIFLLIDGLRADQVYGENKTSVTPNIDSLIKKGLYFTNAFSSVDGTIVSLNTIFSSKFQVGNAARAQRVVLQEKNLLDVLKTNGYHIYGALPDFGSFKSLIEKFENKSDEKSNLIEKNINGVDPVEEQFKGDILNNSKSEYERNHATLPTGLGDRIIQFLKNKNKQEPFFCYFHIFDLHPLREGKKPLGIESFDKEEFGSSIFSRTVSSIDSWLGKILENIDLDNTIVILTADHGERIPYDDFRAVDFQPKLDNAVSVGKKILPKSAHKFGGQFLYNIRKSVGKRRLEKSNKELCNYEKRSRDPYFTLSLFDELLHVPLLFVGNSISPGIIKKQSRHVDILPTLLNLINIKNHEKIDGQDLISKIDKKSIQYLHTMPYQKQSSSDMIGIRTDKYKYFRFARNPDENVHLYDLENDPFENTNIAEGNEKLISEFETKISEIEKNEVSNDDELSEEEQNRISNELKRLGYM